MARARAARYQQDSALAEYYAMARQRWTGQIGIAPIAKLGPVGRMRLAARIESVARVGWHHERGPWAELIASRAVAPIAGEMEPEGQDDGVALTFPYYPGRDVLWPTMELNDAFEDYLDHKKEWIEHPLAEGSDSLYHFTLGGPLTITLPAGKVIHLRELLLRPRRPDQRLVVGSFWVDESSGALVRAAYRPSVAIDFWPMMRENFEDDELSFIEKFGPFLGTAEEIIIEHGLYEERFWLPRVRLLHAVGTAKMARVTISIEQTFDYEKVRAIAPGTVAVKADLGEPANGLYDTRDRWREWQQRADRTLPCREFDDGKNARLSPDSLSGRSDLTWREWEGIKVRVLLPCNRLELVASKALPPSIYGPGEALFTDTDLGNLRDEVSQAFAIDKQAEWEPQPAKVRYGFEPDLWRYNRVEGLSAGARLDRELGKGYSLGGTARLGVADLEPNIELEIRRAKGSGERALSLYRRLDAVNDWGNPLGFGASLTSLFLGRDEGFYQRAVGVSLTSTHQSAAGGPAARLRFFAERQGPAEVGTNFSFSRIADGSRFIPNIDAVHGDSYGGELLLALALGLDPRGTQLSGTLRLEGAGGVSEYGRAMTEWRLARGFSDDGIAAVTAAAGQSTGALPTQRLWYLGGAPTIHAHRAGALRGDGFWMARAEIAKGFPLVRPILFADLGWAGDRREWLTSRERAWAAGVGAAAFDGLVRFDVSRALDRSHRWSVDLFVEIR